MDIDTSDLLSFYGAKPSHNMKKKQNKQQEMNESISASEQSKKIDDVKQSKVQVVEFIDPCAKIRQNVNKSDKRKFMSSSVQQISKVFQQPQDQGKKQESKRVDDSEEEQELKLDKELRKLVNMELEQVTMDSLSGVDRRRMMQQKLNALGLVKDQKCNVPHKIAQGMIKKSKQRALKQSQELKESGYDLIASSSTGRKVNIHDSNSKDKLILTSTSHPLYKTYQRKIKQEKTRKALGVSDKRQWNERGMKMGVGKYVNGALVVNPKHFK